MPEQIPQIIQRSKAYGKLSMQKNMLRYYKNILGSKKESAKSLYTLCVESIQKSTSDITSALDKNDYIGLYNALHKLKGVLGSTGLIEPIDSVTALCSYAKALSKGEITIVSTEFKNGIEELKTYLAPLHGGNI